MNTYYNMCIVISIITYSLTVLLHKVSKMAILIKTGIKSMRKLSPIWANFAVLSKNANYKCINFHMSLCLLNHTETVHNETSPSPILYTFCLSAAVGTLLHTGETKRCS